MAFTLPWEFGGNAASCWSLALPRDDSSCVDYCVLCMCDYARVDKTVFHSTDCARLFLVNPLFTGCPVVLLCCVSALLPSTDTAPMRCLQMHSVISQLEQEVLLPQTDRATRCTSLNLVNCCTTVGTSLRQSSRGKYPYFGRYQNFLITMYRIGERKLPRQKPARFVHLFR